MVSRAEPGSRAMRCKVLHAPAWLPDGYYEATFREQSAFVHRAQGAWSVGIAWAVFPARKKTDPAAEPFLAEWIRTLAV
jgi:hypothetical protein